MRDQVFLPAGLIVVLALVLMGCSSGPIGAARITATPTKTAHQLFAATLTPAASPLPTETPLPTDTLPPHTDTPVPTAIPLPTDTPMPTDTALPPTDAPLPTDTVAPPTAVPPTNTPATPTIEPSPEPITVDPGEIYYRWGFGQFSEPYLVWGAQLRDTMHGGCQGFICDGIDLRLYDPNVWKFLGPGEYGTHTFDFDVDNNGTVDPYERLDTFNTVYGEELMGFDALSGITPDGETVTYGYLADGRITTSFMDGFRFLTKTIIDAEDKFTTVFYPCGVLDPNPYGDLSYNLTEAGDKGGAIFLNFLDRSWEEGACDTRKGYPFTELTIVSQPLSKIVTDRVILVHV